jgi:hypothetical protein
VEQQPPVLVCQGQGLHPVHEGAGFLSTCGRAGRFEGCGADRGVRGEKALGSVVHAQRGGYGCGGACVLGVHHALDRLSAETEGGGEAVKAWKALMVGPWAPWRKVSSTNASGRTRPISTTCSRGSCRVKAKSSGPRGSP